jgi:hypothetical protein
MKLIGIPILLIFWATICPAALVDLDWKTSGDRLLTYDTETQLQWLDLTQTAGLPYTEVNASLGPGDSFAGFFFANSNQLAVFFQHAGITILDQPSALLYQPVSALLQRMGSLDSYQGGISVGLLAPRTIGGQPVVGEFQLLNPSGNAFASVDEGTRPPQEAFSFQGSFLARPAPEPGSAVLVAFGTVVLLRRRPLRACKRNA